MAKQSGLHQLRGKVGEFSYYNQTGINGGIVRRINQGMSSRVKNDAAFANTRLNNAEFGQAGRIAQMLGSMVRPKYRPMILPFSQSKMAKIVLGFIKDDTADWGRRNLTSSSVVDACTSALNAVSKNKIADFGLSFVADEEHGELTINADPAAFEYMRSIGADRYQIRVAACLSCVGISLATNLYYPSIPRYNYSQVLLADGNASITVQYTVPSAPAPQTNFVTGRFLLIEILPQKVEGDLLDQKVYTLQEHCTFASYALVDGPLD